MKERGCTESIHDLRTYCTIVLFLNLQIQTRGDDCKLHTERGQPFRQKRKRFLHAKVDSFIVVLIDEL